ncbi:aminomethyl-transferring glycine dehydrogenase subunit GcvPB [Sediminispirochaeta bajacaliforniensis]|uniref:aminomethyl-transferring glycine dehydrogenase subunit GcvPB n=1 Tax=Sediminispirochaeta bajacaliforniensis TaxID=148 RepID=UPI00036AAB71|nr:aminomethyl-transferring glycine dehydrogenase subunit GcvPB [Sediminispirochaeta bajacaliforniensis]
MDGETQLIFERSVAGRRGFLFPENDMETKPIDNLIPENYRRNSETCLPEVSEVDVVRHFTELASRSFGVDAGFYPLGSCTMKYNPKVNEDIAALSGFTSLHPLQPSEDVQGILELMYKLTKGLCELTGMQWGTLQPFAGAHGEFTGMKLFKAYFKSRGEHDRRKILVPTSAHGTNPASAHISGFEVQEIEADHRGLVSIEDLKKHLDENLAGIMLTNPNTLGLFEKDIETIATLVHDAGGLLYYDGANLNAIMGKVRPGDMGFDVIHMNLHKTFSTPHGGGGPGAGPVLVSKRLVKFLPVPDVEKQGEAYDFCFAHPESIGRISGFYGNIGVLTRAYAFLLAMGSDGLTAASEMAVLNANYLRSRLKTSFSIPFEGICKHEFVLSAKNIKEEFGISALDVAKALLDAGIHPPTIYFPLIVPEALMIEPTESESKETLDRFVEVMESIAKQAAVDPQKLHDAPHQTPVRRVDEVQAAKHPIVAWRPE